MPASPSSCRRPTTSSLFPYTTLFRSPVRLADDRRRPRAAVAVRPQQPDWRRRGQHAEGRVPRARVRHVAVRRPHRAAGARGARPRGRDRKSTRLNSSHSSTSYAGFSFKLPAAYDVFTLSLHDALPISRSPCRRSSPASCCCRCTAPTARLASTWPTRRRPCSSRSRSSRCRSSSAPCSRCSRSSTSRPRSEEHTSELQSQFHLVCRLLLQAAGGLRRLHSFPTRRSSDLPFALPTIVAGLVLLSLYGPNSPIGVDVANTQKAVFLALAFVTLPFVVRTVQPVLEELDLEAEIGRAHV